MAEILHLVGIGYDRLTTNLRKSFDGMSPEKWIRLVIVVGTYCLLRPYMMKWGSKVQMKQHEQEAAATKAAEKAAAAQMSPNELRGYKEIPEDSDDDDGGGGGGGEGALRAQATATEWGKKARKRQRNTIKKILAAEEQRLQDMQDDDEDKDIAEFLTG